MHMIMCPFIKRNLMRSAFCQGDIKTIDDITKLAFYR